jgi:hypothetical protein
MVADACAVVPPAPVAVAVKVVVVKGTIAAEPESATVVTSSPSGEGVMETEVAFVLAQVRVVLCPEATTVGEKLKVMVGVEPAAATVTITADVTERPFASVAVAV